MATPVATEPFAAVTKPPPAMAVSSVPDSSQSTVTDLFSLSNSLSFETI